MQKPRHEVCWLGNAPALDGFVGFSSTAPFTFDPNNRAIAGENDFIGAAEHEISEVMGRYGMGQNAGTLGRFSPIDLFRYASPGVLDLVPANGAYFSINGGTTVIHTFNGPNGGDLSDWLKGAIADSYDVGPTLGSEAAVSSEDVTLMDVIGYDAAVPPLSGDYNGNGVVDAADYTVWRDTLGSTTDLASQRRQHRGERGGCRPGRLQSLENEFWNARCKWIGRRRKCRCSGAGDFVDALHRNLRDCLLPTLSGVANSPGFETYH